jgi:hypothetical protein
MPIIQATTPTKAGWAQAFDTSGIAGLAIKQKEKRAKKLQDLLVEYDTKGIFTRDIPEVQRQISEVQNFAMEHSKELANPSQHMDVWREFQDKQSRVKNTVTYSIGAKEQFDKANRMYHAENGKYLTEANAAALEAYATTPTSEQYGDLSAFGDPSKGFERNVELDFNDYRKIVDNAWTDTPPEATGEAIEGTNKYIYKEGKQLDMEKLEKALRVKWEKSGLESGDLQHTYKDKGGFDAFVEDAIAMSADPTSYGLAATPAEGEISSAEAKAQRKAETAWLQVDKSSQSITEEIGGYQEIEDKEGRVTTTWVPQPEGDWADAQNVVTHYGPMLVGGAGMVAGERYIMDGSIRKGMNAQTGKPIENNDGANVKQQLIKEIGDYKYVHTDFDIDATDKKGNATKIRFEKGTYMPDLDAMLEDKALTPGQYDDAVKKMAARTRTEKAAFVFASTSKVSLWDMPEEDFENYMKDKSAGQSWAVVPYESVEAWLDGEMYEEHGTTMNSYMADQEWKKNDEERKAREAQKTKDREQRAKNPGQASDTKAALDALK